MSIICNAKTRGGGYCKKSPLSGKVRCRCHGGASLSGVHHWNYKHGKCTKSYRLKVKEVSSQIRLLAKLADSLGMLTHK